MGGWHLVESGFENNTLTAGMGERMKLMTSLVACGLLVASAGVQAADGSALSEILESGTLKVGTTEEQRGQAQMART